MIGGISTMLVSVMLIVMVAIEWRHERAQRRREAERRTRETRRLSHKICTPEEAVRGICKEN